MKAQICSLIVLLTLGCAAKTLPGTAVKDTPRHRAVYETLVELVEALRQKDSEGVLVHISPRFYEDMGTETGEDDYGKAELAEKILPQTFAHVSELRLDFEIHDITVESKGQRAQADLRYRSRAHLELPAGKTWDEHREFNRLELAREGGAWKVVSGL